jgi:hypothetical protein
MEGLRDVSCLRFAVVVLGALGLASLLGHIDPFAALGAWLVGAEMRLQPTVEDPAHIDPKHGEDLRASLDALHRTDGSGGGRRRWVVFFGNSQQYTASLPRGATPDSDRRAEIASVLLGRTLEERAPAVFRVYNASAPNQNYTEALWQALYWYEIPPAPPVALILQASFDTFRKTAIRPGYQTLLDDPRFVTGLGAYMTGQGEREYFSDFRAAQRDRAQRMAEMAGNREGSGYRQWSPEPTLRQGMEQVALFRRRETLRESFLGALYAVRVRGLGISPTSRRHIVGPPLAQNFAALADLISLARQRGTRVLLYNAPVNPAVSMFFEEEYGGYVARLAQLCREKGVPFADLATAVPAERWGYWIDGPDPIHFDEQAHRIMHDRLVEAFGPLLLSLASRP